MPNDGIRTVNVLLSWGIPLWLGSIRLGGRSPAYRRRVQLLQREVGAALAQRFAGFAVPAPAQEALPEPRTARHTLLPMQKGKKLQQPARAARGSNAEELAGIKATIQRLDAGLNGLTLEVRSLQHELRAKTARDEARLAVLEGYRVREHTRIERLERWLAHLARTVAHLTVEPLASLARLVITERLLAASIERLLEMQEQVSRLEPKPPPRPTRRGRPRREQRR